MFLFYSSCLICLIVESIGNFVNALYQGLLISHERPSCLSSAMTVCKILLPFKMSNSNLS